MEEKRKLTTAATKEKVAPHGSKVSVVIKSWPAQSQGGLLLPDSYTVIRGEMYICKIVRIGKDVSIVKPEDTVVVSMYSGHHIATTNGFLKVIEETDILTHKEGDGMTVDPTTFKPGINYLLIRIEKVKELVTESGLYIPDTVSAGLSNSNSKQDVATIVATVVAKGDVNEFGKKYDTANVGDSIVIDSYSGLDIPNFDVNADAYYRVLYNNNVVATIEK